MLTGDRAAIIDGARIAYRDTGGPGQAAVLLHGTPSHSYIWREVASGLARAGHRVVTYDLLGYGRSERPVDRDTSVAGQAQLFGRLLDHLGLGRVDLIGHDIGGAIGQLVATHSPERVRRLALIDTVSYDSWPSPTWQEVIRDHLDDYAAMPAEEFEALLTRQLTMTVADPKRMSGEVLESYLAPHRSRLGRTSFFEHQVRHHDSRYTERIAGDLVRLSMPVRILWGERDAWQPLAYARRLRDDIPGAELTIVPDAGHFLMEDAPDRVTAELTAFLAA